MAEGGAAGTTAVSLPRDAIFDILSWTPVKSVCRFRCVSKEWLSGISNPAFNALHRSRAGSVPLVVTSYHGKTGNNGVRVMDMKGNVLRTIEGLGNFPSFCSSLDNLVSVRSADATHVVDIITGRKVLVTRRESDDCYYYTIRLGRAAVSGSYKVVRVGSCKHDRRKQTCDVLTFGDGAMWRRAQPPPAVVSLNELYSSGATVNGALHFLSDSKNVLCFDLESEEWSRTIQGLPEADIELGSKTGEIRTTELNNALCMIQTKESQAPQLCINIWLLVDLHNSIWVKAYTIPIAFLPSSDSLRSLCVMPYSSSLLLYYTYVIWPEHVLRVYDPIVGTCTDAMKLPKDTFGKIGICNLHLDCFVTPDKGRRG